VQTCAAAETSEESCDHHLQLPLKGNVGTAAYLDVFGSIYEVMQALRHNGYDVDLPSSALA